MQPRTSSLRVVGLAAGFVAALCLALVVGVVSTELLSDGLTSFDGPTRLAAQDALQWAQLGCSEPLDRVLRRRFQVAAVQLVAGYCPGGAVPAYQATVRTYTLFMIQTGEVSVSCSSVQCLK